MKNIQFANEVEVNFMPIGNRAVDFKKVNAIKASMQKYGICTGITLIQTSLFSGKNAYYGVDGQHRYEAARALNMLDKLPVYLVQRKFKSISEIVAFVSNLNSTQTPWVLINYINAYASIEKPDYKKLLDKVTLYGLGCALTAVVYGGAERSVVSRMVKAGSFKIIDESKGDQIMGYMQDIVVILGKANSATIAHFACAYYNWFSSIKRYNHKKFIKFLDKNKDKLMVLGTDGITLLLADFK